MEREVGYYITYAFLPSFMPKRVLKILARKCRLKILKFYKKCQNPKKCVVLSWASFWMKLSIAPARVGLGITTYLSIKTLANSFQDGMPRVAYLKVSCFVTPHFRPFIFDIIFDSPFSSILSDRLFSPAEQSYLQALDIWMIGCDTFIFVAFLEYTMAQYLLRKKTRSPKCNGCFCNKMPHNLSGLSFHRFTG